VFSNDVFELVSFLDSEVGLFFHVFVVVFDGLGEVGQVGF